MTDAPDYKTHDIAEMFAGVSFPSDVVTIYTDAGIAYEFNKLSAESVEAVKEKDEEKARDIAQRREDLVKKAAAHRYEFHLRGQSKDNRKAILDRVREEFPPEVDPIFGREKIDPKADEVYANRFWALHVERIEGPNGFRIAPPTEADIKIFRGQAPDSETEKIERAIQELSQGAKSGFESLAREHDFLSSASPEA